MVDPVFIGFGLGYVFGVPAHEAGHYWAARVRAIPVSLCSIGRGPLVFARRLGEARLEFRLLPIGGYVIAAPDSWHRRSGEVLVILGGVMANLALFVLLIGLAAANQGVAWAQAVIQGMVVAQILMIVVNLLPLPMRIEGRPVGTDGWQLLRLIRRRRRRW